MAERTGISWADATLNFWVGCTKVSTGDKGACQFCYAEVWAKRWPAYRDTWGLGAPRARFAHLLAKAMKLERLALAKLAAGGGTFFCFSNSLSDIFDKEVPIEWLAEAFEIMRATPHVTYLLLTKRGPNIVARSEAAGGLPRNAAIGCTVVTQAEADRDVPTLRAAKDALKPAFTFVSMEPLMEGVDFSEAKAREYGAKKVPTNLLHGLDWVIAGGESGVQARPSHPSWFRDLRDQCAAAGVPFHFKQWGEWAPGENCGPIKGPQTGASISTGGQWFAEDFSQRDAEAFTADDEPDVWRVGKKTTGRLLDGVLHDARPEVA